MIRPVSASRPVDVLRQSSDQIRRAAELLAEITDETAAAPAGRYGALFPGDPAPDPADVQSAREATILKAQRSFAALRLRQVRDGSSTE